MPGPPCSVGVALDAAHPAFAAKIRACLDRGDIQATTLASTMAAFASSGRDEVGYLPDDCPRPSAYMIRFHRRGACACD